MCELKETQIKEPYRPSTCDKTIKIINCIATKLHSPEDGGAFFVSNKYSCSLKISGTIVSSCTAERHYGGFYAHVKDSDVSRSCFYQCHTNNRFQFQAFCFQVGGSSYNTNSLDQVTVLNCPENNPYIMCVCCLDGGKQKSDDNNATNSYMKGAYGFCLWGSTANSKFSRNTVANSLCDRAVYLDGEANPDPVLTIQDWNIVNNSVPEGAFYNPSLTVLQEAVIKFCGCVIKGNNHNRLAVGEGDFSLSFFCSNAFSVPVDTCSETHKLFVPGTGECQQPNK